MQVTTAARTCQLRAAPRRARQSRPLRAPHVRAHARRKRAPARAQAEPSTHGPRVAARGRGAGVDDQDRLLTYGPWTYTYTANGELETKTNGSQTWSYDYDVFGNLKRVDLPGGDIITYVIDGQNRRVGKKRNGTLEKQWLYGDQLHPVAELDGSGALVARFVWASGKNTPDLVITGGVTYRVFTDQLGSPRLLVNAATGAVGGVMRHDAWGVVLEDTVSGLMPFGFAGGLYDGDTGLVRFGARDYDALVGRWVSKDPIRFGGSDVPNLCLYVDGDPVNLADPTGLQTPGAPGIPWWGAGLGEGISSGLGAAASAAAGVLAMCLAAVLTSDSSPDKWQCSNDAILPSNGGTPICTYTCYNPGTGELRSVNRLAYPKRVGARATDMKWACMDPAIVAESQGI